MATATKKKSTKGSSKPMLADSFKNLLAEKYQEALDGTCEQHGIWSVPFESCTTNVGFVETRDGRKAQVTITVQTDESEWMD